MQRHTWNLGMWSVAALVALVAVPPSAAQTGTIRCESLGSSREQCAIERGARVELARHLSETPCRQNANWGVGQGFLWVSGGCRADFLVTAIATYPSGEGNAAATPTQLRACRTEADRRLSAYSYKQIDVEPYSRQGSTAWVRWLAGTTEGMCTVATNGRVLQFTTAGTGSGWKGLAGATRITCQSKTTGRQECRIPEGARIRLVRQVGESPCRLNDTYGRGAGYLWVAEGCRGEFEVTRGSGVTAGGSEAGEPADGTGLPASPGLTDRVTCESKGADRTDCPIRSGGQVQLVRQLSTAACIRNSTWGTSYGALWVTKGCRGEFEVR